MTHHLYRNILRKATVVCLLFSVPLAFAQRRYQPPAGPRAVGLIQVAPNGTARLVPIVYYENGKYYDARYYKANPAPLVIDPETVYEGQKTGTAEGLFTVNNATQMNGNWYGVGKWSSYADQPKNVDKPKESITAPIKDEDRERPILRRPGSKKQSAPATAPPEQPKDSRQTASKRDENAPPPETESDPDRPRLKKPATSSPEPAKETQPAQVEGRVESAREPKDDPNRPVLRRGKPKQQQQEEEYFPGMGPNPAEDKPATASAAVAPKPTVQFKTFVAVSDAKPSDPRPYEFQWNPEERTRQTAAIAKLAATELAKFATERKISLPKKLDGKTDVRAFDVDYSNNPEIVFTGVYPVAPDASGRPNEIYVTYIASIGYEDKPQKIFSSVTDSRHLDVATRLELIDAVDVDGDGRGELLFREYTDQGTRYAAYQASYFQVSRIFTGGSGE